MTPPNRLPLLCVLTALWLIGCQTPQDRFHYSGGNGQTPDQEIVVKEAQDASDVIRGEDYWISLHFKHSVILRRELVTDPFTGITCDHVVLKTADGTVRSVFFHNPFAAVDVQVPAGYK
jgi:hypothetical protein